jgi:hypothetical protein
VPVKQDDDRKIGRDPGPAKAKILRGHECEKPVQKTLASRIKSMFSVYFLKYKKFPLSFAPCGYKI